MTLLKTSEFLMSPFMLVMSRDSRKSRQKIVKNTADFC